MSNKSNFLSSEEMGNIKEATKIRNFKVKERKRLGSCEYGYVRIDLCESCIEKFK